MRENPTSRGYKAMLLFTYGTLRRGYRNHHYLENARFVAQAKSNTRFSLHIKKTTEYPEGYPFAQPSQENDAVNLKGEIYEIDEDILKAIDILEDYPHEYTRIELPFECDDGTLRNALIYIGKDF